MFLGWDPDDQDKALQFEREKRLHCTGCGTRMDEWERDRFAYTSWSYQCPGCELLDREREQTPEHARGMHYKLLPPDEVRRLMDEAEERMKATAPDGDGWH